MKIFAGLLALFVTMPIWCYLLYKILVAVNATELMWFYIGFMSPLRCLWELQLKY